MNGWENALVDLNLIESRKAESPPHSKPLEFERAEPQWMHYGDIIRILGTIAVVIGHVSDMILYQTHDPGSAAGLLTGPGTLNWYVCNIWDSAMRWAVPIYIMLSGSLLLDPNRVESPSRFYHKRLMRIGVPLVFWSFFFMWVDVYYTGWRATHNLAGQPDYEIYKDNGWVFLWSANSLFQWFHNFIHYQPQDWGDHTRWDWVKYLVLYRPQLAWINLLKGQPYMHMHFIFRIAGLYAFTPVLRVCLRHISRPMLIATVITMLAMSSADSVANNITGTTLSAFARFVPFLGYYLVGYLLRNAIMSWKMLLGCTAGLLMTIAVLAYGTQLLVQHDVIDAAVKAGGNTATYAISGPPSLNMMLYDFLSPVRVVMAVFAWVVLVNIFRNPWPRGERGRSIIRFWANTTLGLYLIHPLFREMWFMQAPKWIGPHIEEILKMHGGVMFHKFQTVLNQWKENGLNATFPNVWEGVPFVTVLVYVPSLIATIIIMRIPYVRRIAG
jgi:surface polysaccharide O-acyltransferase-like enzyme